MTRRPLLAGLAALLLAVTMRAEAQQEDRRLEDLQQQITETAEILNEITNETDRVEWQQRLDLLELDYNTLKEKLQIAREEKSLARERVRSKEQVLLDALRAINNKTDVLQADIERIETQTREFRAELAKLAEQRRDLQFAADRDEDDEERLVELDLKTRNKEEEISATMLQRDVAEIRFQLGEHAIRIDDMLRNRPINIKPTIQNIMADKSHIEGEVRRRDDAMAWLGELQGMGKQHQQSLALSEAKLAHIDAEIELLKTKSSTRLGRLRIGLVAKHEKKLLAGRIKLQRDQVDAIANATQLTSTTIDLLNAEIDYIQSELDKLVTRSWQRVVLPALAILAILLVSFVVSRTLLPLFVKRDRLFVARRLGGYFVMLLALLVVALFFMEDLRAIAVFMGIAGAALVIALQDLVSSFVGWFVIISSRKFGVGDRVEIDEHRGDVIDIQLLRTTLIELNNWLGVDEPTGRIIIVPNSFIFKSKVLNYAHVHPGLWGHIDITVTYETPAKKAHDVLMQIVSEEAREEFEEAREGAGLMERRYGVPDTVYQPKIYTIIADSGVLYRIIYVAHYRRFSSTRTRINNRIIEVFDKDPDLEFAYPTERHIPTPEGDAFSVEMSGKSISDRG